MNFRANSKYLLNFSAKFSTKNAQNILNLLHIVFQFLNCVIKFFNFFTRHIGVNNLKVVSGSNFW